MDRPLTIIIFGVTGDLAQKKLLPALLDLYTAKLLPENFSVIGFSRRAMSESEFVSFVRELLNKKGNHYKEENIAGFVSHIAYVQGSFDVPESYQKLALFLRESDARHYEGCSNKLFYLAVPPTYYDAIFTELAQSGLSIPCAKPSPNQEWVSPPKSEAEWVRIAVEKPFGRDLQTAQALDQRLGRLFKEDQIFRIDHYLAKEAVENILAFRFSNTLFTPAWNREYIESVHIRFLENSGVGTRGAFYEDVGALRDVGQNHSLQMLALIAMEDPEEISSVAIRRAREEVLAQLIPLSKDAIAHKTVKGQYKLYREENNVASDSLVETYYKIEAFIDNERWQGVPFILEGGKMMEESCIDITVTFKPVSSCMSREGKASMQNKLVFTMSPKEEISISFWAKKRGFTMDVEPRRFAFQFDDGVPEERTRDAYEKLLIDAIKGDQTLFNSSREVENAWKFVTPILEAWQKREPVIYNTYKDLQEA